MGRSDKNFESRRARILEAATAVFAAQGFEGTTNKLIAEELQRRTGGPFSAQLIYHYFESKQALFQAVLQQLPAPQVVASAIREVMHAPPEVFFRHVARAYLGLFEDPVTASVLRIALTEGARQPELTESIAELLVPAYARPMTEYLRAQVKQGRLAPCNPMAVLLQFFGALVQSRMPLSGAIARRMGFKPLAGEALVDALIAQLLHGLRPPADASPPKKGEAP
jgi:AcrR family transcriptional regulator